MAFIDKVDADKVVDKDAEMLNLVEEWGFLAAALVLYLNDHYLKYMFHNFLTGKLSDVVGPFVLYRVLRGIDSWGIPSKASLLLTISVAVAIKTSQDLADLAASLTCGLIFDNCHFIADPTDLIAYVPFLLFAAFKFLPRQRNLWGILGVGGLPRL